MHDTATSATQPAAASAPTPLSLRRSVASSLPPSTLSDRYTQIRQSTESLCQPLATEDYVLQSMPDASPAKWHLAHTSWFFETFILARFLPDYQSPHPQYNYLFNSYYQSVGPQHSRPRRGLISRPTVEETYAYRAYVDEQMLALLDPRAGADDKLMREVEPLVVIGLNHEQQHQELLLTDIKHAFAANPLRPAYAGGAAVGAASAAAPPATPAPPARSTPPPLQWRQFEPGVHSIGHGGDGFAYDNESPRHRVFVEPFEIATRLVTCGEYLEFINDGGYSRPEIWLSDGWNQLQAEQWTAPLYWEMRDGNWQLMTLAGMCDLDPRAGARAAEPVCHVSYYEADAYARWASARLPTEAEWEIAALRSINEAPHEPAGFRGNFAESARFHPAPPSSLRRSVASSLSPHLEQMFGDAWEWTGSAYLAYPGYKPPEGALGEYNGKFMCNQFVLRGGSCATPQSHIRPTYRNFFPPAARWQFTGIRLARST